MFIELHILQNFAPSCLNRDDTNTPKDCIFGGHRRARISSQCVKRSVRQDRAFRGIVGGLFATRSNQHFRMVAQQLADKHGKPLQEAMAIARYLFQKMGFKEKNQKLSVMLVLGQDEIVTVTKLAVQHYETLNPLANASLLWDQFATKLGTLFKDSSSHAELLGRLVANHKAGNANATQLTKWIELPDSAWADVLGAIPSTQIGRASCRERV